MENYGIQNPCHENWLEMTPNEQGAFCGSCQKNVADWSSFSTSQVLEQMKSSSSSSTCVRMEVNQYQSVVNLINRYQQSKATQMKTAGFLTVFLVFGMSLFASASPGSQHAIQQVHKQLSSAMVSETLDSGPGDTTAVAPRGNRAELDTNFAEVNLPQIEIRGMRRTETVDHRFIVGAYYMPSHHMIEEIQELDKNGVPIPEEFNALLFPNPTRGLSQVKIELPKADRLTFQLVDMTGRILQQFEDRQLEPGTHQVRFNFDLKERGIYLLQIAGSEYQEAIQVYFEE